MGFSDVRLYDYSWDQWGNKSLYYPVETKANELIGTAPGAVSMAPVGARPAGGAGQQRDVGRSAGGQSGGGKSGYISCGG
jgi:thiosulfate/3-mercaptopyruvate sulfurtransferase